MRVNSCLFTKHSKKPISNGSITEIIVHLMLLVSLYIVIKVVEQGKWKSEKMMKFTAVRAVQPFSLSILFSWSISEYSAIELLFRYIINRTGITISFAGIPNKNARSIAPSRPTNSPIGDNKPDNTLSTEAPFIVILETRYSIKPAGAATNTALVSISEVLSYMDLMMVLDICGIR